jgi:peptidoglycan/xylan/chitin deacetylase (PgdA/CDA1 family)/folate-dependent phosphoribosylglycinamide formyltransferase PurN
MKSVIMYHVGSKFEEELLQPWLSSFSDVVGVIKVENKPARKLSRLRHEYNRSGLTGSVDAIAFRMFDNLRENDVSGKVDNLISNSVPQWGEKPDTASITVETPNNNRTADFLEEKSPDVVIARIKLLLEKEIFSIPNTGTFAIHPGICPEYRNAHGCFWALVHDKPEKVGYTLLKIDEGIDTGDIYAQGGTDFDRLDHHTYIQYQVVADNLEEIRDSILAAHDGRRDPIDVDGRESNIWGQPTLSAYLRYRRREHRRRAIENRDVCLLYHDVVPDTESSQSGLTTKGIYRYKLTPDQFANHLDLVHKQAAEVRLVNDKPPGSYRGGIYLTFDDGGVSLHDYAAPVLKKYDMKGHISIITDRIGHPNFLDESQIKELHNEGHLIVSHTVSHQDLTSIPDDTLKYELEESKETLEQIIDSDCTVLSVPGGAYNQRVIERAQSFGYDYIFTSDPTFNPVPPILGRWNQWRHTSARQMEAIIHRRPFPIIGRQLRWNLLEAVRAIIGRHRYMEIRERII